MRDRVIWRNCPQLSFILNIGGALIIWWVLAVYIISWTKILMQGTDEHGNVLGMASRTNTPLTGSASIAAGNSSPTGSVADSSQVNLAEKRLGQNYVIANGEQDQAIKKHDPSNPDITKTNVPAIVHVLSDLQNPTRQGIGGRWQNTNEIPLHYFEGEGSEHQHTSFPFPVFISGISNLIISFLCLLLMMARPKIRGFCDYWAQKVIQKQKDETERNDEENGFSMDHLYDKSGFQKIDDEDIDGNGSGDGISGISNGASSNGGITNKSFVSTSVGSSSFDNSMSSRTPPADSTKIQFPRGSSNTDIGNGSSNTNTAHAITGGSSFQSARLPSSDGVVEYTKTEKIVTNIASNSSHPQNRRFVMYVLVIGAIQGVEIGASNTSLYFLPIVVRTMMHSMTPIFMYMVSTYIMQLDGTGSNRLIIVSIVCCSIGGIFLCHKGAESGQETAFKNISFLGICCTLLSGFGGCFRWGFLQKLLRMVGKDAHVIDVLFYTSPITSVTLVTGSLIFESGAFLIFLKAGVASYLWRHILCIGFSVLGVILCELKLVQLTSALTLCIFGVCHNLLIVVSGVILFGEKMNEVQVSGILVGQLGVFLYGVAKISAKREAENINANLMRSNSDLKPTKTISDDDDRNYLMSESIGKERIKNTVVPNYIQLE